MTANNFTRATVAVYRQSLLGLSETFIRKQVTALERWNAVLVGVHRVPGGLDLSGVDVRCLEPAEASLPRRGLWWALRRLGLAERIEGAWFRRLGASLFHVHFGVDAVRLWPLLRQVGAPVLVTLHGYDINIESGWWQSGAGGDTNRDYHDRLRAMARHPLVHFVAVSEAIRRRAVELGLPADKVEVMHIGVDITEFRPAPVPVPQRALRVLFVGRLVEKKGCEILIRAMARVRRAVPGAELEVLGDGPRMSHCRQLSDELAVGARFLGSQPSSRVKAALGEARVFCLPSITAENGDAEGLPIVLLEAQACGVPVVTSANGGREEGILDGETGFAFAEGDELALAEKLIALIRDDALLQRMSTRAADFARERFDISRCTARLEQYYDRLVSTSGKT